jgi:hypothetical protein
MPDAPSDHELQEFFDEVWRLAEQAGASQDQQLAPYLFELADEIVTWRNALLGGRELEGS